MTLPVAGATYNGISKLVSGQDSSPFGLAFKSDGSKMYVSGTTNDTIYEYDLSTAWLVSSATYNSVSKLVSGQTTSPFGLAFKSDGSKMYVTGGGGGATIYEYDLSTAWLVSSATYNSVSKLVSGQDSSPAAVTFKSDGSKMYVSGNTNDTIYEYDLSTAWLVSSATYNSVSKLVSGQTNIPCGLAFNSDGSKMYMVGRGGDGVYEYDLSTAWLVSSATYNGISKLVSGQDDEPFGLAFNADGSKMYVSGTTSATVYEYDMMPVYLYGSASTPADGAAATGTADPTAVTPPSGMLAGDLVCMIGQQRATGATLAISQAGGQTWTSEAAIGITNQTDRLFWCTFNGTWSADPSVDFSAATCNSVQMHVFRPPSTDYTWEVNQALAETEDASSPYANPGQTTTGTDPTVTLVGWFTADDNSWNASGDTGWQVAGTAQYRNTSGSDQSAAYEYKLQTSAGATGAVDKTQNTVTGDACTTFAITFAATPGGTSVAITGTAATGAVGTLGSSRDKALTGNAATAAVGTTTPALDKALTGNAATGAPGTLAPALDKALTGNAATGAVGTVGTLGGDVAIALSGNAATGAVGTLGSSRDKALTGNAATAAVGTAVPAMDKALTGNAATAAVGTVSNTLAVALTGNAATAAVGTVSNTLAVALTGNAATGAVGTVTVVGDTTVALTGVAATAAVGTVGNTLGIALSGNAASADVGIVVPGLAKALSGVSASAAIGTLAALIELPPRLSQAIREAYASAPAGVIILHTLEFRHPNFVDDFGQATAIRVVLDHANLDARLELDAPQNPGEYVTFIAFAFELSLPNIEASSTPEISISLDNVTREIEDSLALAALSPYPVEVTYRPYLNTDLSAPQMNPPLTLTLTSAEADDFRVTARASYGNTANRPYPAQLYNTTRFPGLMR